MVCESGCAQNPKRNHTDSGFTRFILAKLYALRGGICHPMTVMLSWVWIISFYSIPLEFGPPPKKRGSIQHPTWKNNLVDLKASGLLKSHCYGDSPVDIPH